MNDHNTKCVGFRSNDQILIFQRHVTRCVIKWHIPAIDISISVNSASSQPILFYVLFDLQITQRLHLCNINGTSNNTTLCNAKLRHYCYLYKTKYQLSYFFVTSFFIPINLQILTILFINFKWFVIHWYAINIKITCII